MKPTKSTRPLILQGYFSPESRPAPVLRTAAAPPSPSPALPAIPTPARRGAMQPKPKSPATAKPPRPELLPARLRGAVGQPKATKTTTTKATPAKTATPRAKALPGMAPSKLAASRKVAQPRSDEGISTTPVPATLLLKPDEGKPLEANTRKAMESLFRADFSSVRIHESTAPQSMGALAVTQGEAIHFAPGRYDPTTRKGLDLLGHELMHVLQQREGRVTSAPAGGVAIVQDPSLEAEADAMRRRAAALRPLVVRSRRAKPLAVQRRVGTRRVGTVQRAEESDDDEKVRAPISALYDAVSDYDQRMAFIAHWIWWEGKVCKVVPIAAEADAAGLESSSAKHPDQTFWSQKLTPRPHKSAAIVTDCKLLPCVKTQYRGCAHALPRIIASRLGAGIPIACFGHGEGSGERQVFYTESGASREEVDEALGNVYTWEWDSEYDPRTY